MTISANHGRIEMNTTRTKIVTAAIMFTASFAVGPASAQIQADRSVDQYLCKDIMRESGSGREVPIAFLHGFLLGKSGSQNFNVDLLLRKTDAFIDYCLENPNEKAIDAMMKAKN
jgi:hypothetical protein